MSHRLRLLCLAAALVGTFVLPSAMYGQIFNGQQQKVLSPDLQNQLRHWEVYRMDAAGLYSFLQDNPQHAPAQIQLGQHHWRLALTPSTITAPNYTLQVLTSHGVEISKPTAPKAFRGNDLSSGGQARLTVDQNFIYGFVEEGGERYYIEPLWYYVPTAAHDLFVVYAAKDVNRDINATCAVVESEQKLQHLQNSVPSAVIDAAESVACYQVELAIASDRLMFLKYGSVGGVESHNLGVINNTEADYTSGSFNHDLFFVIVTQFVSTGTDPWTNSTDAGTLLDSFVGWGNSNGFGESFDLGELWTDRDFSGGTVGIAYLDAVCTSIKYHCLQDFTGNGELLRCMTSHEIGHNFSCGHDGGGGTCPPDFIMCPFVSTSSQWSALSISDVNSFIVPLIANGCLSSCGGGGGGNPVPLVANFDWSPNAICVGESVHFNDLSTGAITSRTWTFPSGTPGSSSQTNPLVTWNTPGTFQVKLTLTGTGGPVSITKAVTVEAAVEVDFTYTVSGTTVSFNNNSNYGNLYTWTFGDGQTSTDANPVHTYSTAGMYNVKLTAFNDCGNASRTIAINTEPTADFFSSQASGCAPLNVQFTNLSSANATSYTWEFPGGTPSTSTQYDPTIVYTTPGTYPVILTATNAVGSYTFIQPNYIVASGRPTVAFSSTIAGATATFTNTSTNATSYSWNFGDNTTGTIANPSHTYTANGTYAVVLTATNNCGTSTATHPVVITAIVTSPTASFTAANAAGCSPLTVQFTSTSSANAQTFNWQFPGGTPSSSTLQNPAVVYNTAGTYSATLTVGNAAGNNTATQTNVVTVNPSPTAAFSSTIAGTTASFTNTSTNATSYAWNFGDNGTAASATPSHTYTANGTYTVVLTATNSCGSSTATHTVVITAVATVPTASFTAANAAGCSPLTVQFTSTSSANTQTFNWQFPGGTPSSSTAQNPAVVYGTAGTYSATLTVGNAAGNNTATQTNVVMVNPSPTAAFSSTIAGTTASFTNTSTNATSYAWNFGDNTTATTATPSHTYTAGGTYTVVLTAINSCGTTTATNTVVIVTSPTASFTAANAAGCSPLTVQFTSTSSANAQTFNWQFPGGTPNSSTAQNPAVVYGTAGTYSVTLTVGNAAGNNTATQTNVVTVNPSPTTAFSSTLVGTTASFANTSTNATSYAWNFGDNGTAASATPSHTYTANGTYTVVLTATNSCGSSTATHTVVITAVATVPIANFTATNASGCGPLTVQFTSTSSANTQTFNWQFPGGTPNSSTAQNPAVVYGTAGTYSATLTVGNAAGNNTATQTNVVTVNPNPTAAFSSTIAGTTASFTNTSTNATSYAWNFGDNGTAASATPSHTYTANGTYTVVLTATNSCGSSTATHTVVITAVATVPTASFTAANAAGCSPLTVQFTSTSSANTQTFNWQFPGGTPSSSTLQNPAVVYNTAGTYSATLTVGNAAGNNTTTQTNVVTVNPNPTAAFSSTIAGTTASFTNTSTNATSYAWNFGDNGTAASATPSHTYTANGTYTVVLTATNSCGSSTATHTVVITAVATVPIANFTATNASGCGPLTVQFTSTSSANTQTFNWQFPGGTPSSSTAQNPAVVYGTAGTYSATLTVGNAAGNNTATQTNVVMVNPSPTTAFSSTLVGTTASFTNTSTNATSYAWNFGDNGTAASATPSHTYTANGTYTVVLTATNSCGSSTATHTVVTTAVATVPIANFTASNASDCGPLSVQFTSTSSANAQTFNWQFPGGTPSSSTAQNPAVIYGTAGTYSVTLTVGNAAGNNTATQTDLVIVSTVPTTAFSSTLVGTTASFTNNSTNATTYAWDFGDSTNALTATPSHTYTADGTYTVTLTTTNSCGTSTFTQNVVVITSPSAGFTANTTTGCAALTVQFSDLSSGNTTAWNWTFPGGTPATSTLQHPTVIYATPGTYDATLVASTTAGSSTYTQNGFITILESPTAAFTSTNDGPTFTFTNTSSNAIVYTWDFGDGSSSSVNNPTHTYADDGIYQVTLTATNNCGTATYTQPSSVSTVPTAAFTVNTNKGCAPLAVQFTNQSSSNATTVTWTFEGGNPATSSATNPAVTWSQAGTYNVLLLVSNGAGTDTASTIVTVSALPTAAFTIQTAGLLATFTNTSANGTTYNWKFGDGTISDEPNPTHTYVAAGIYMVELTVANSCGAATLQQTFTITTVGASEPNWLSQFRVYPNPNVGRFTVEMQGKAQQEVEFALFNIIGQLVYREVADFGTGDLNQLLDCTSLPAAMYTLRISAGEQATFVKIVVQR